MSFRFRFFNTAGHDSCGFQWNELGERRHIFFVQWTGRQSRCISLRFRQCSKSFSKGASTFSECRNSLGIMPLQYSALASLYLRLLEWRNVKTEIECVMHLRAIRAGKTVNTVHMSSWIYLLLSQSWAMSSYLPVFPNPAKLQESYSAPVCKSLTALAFTSNYFNQNIQTLRDITYQKRRKYHKDVDARGLVT